MFVSYVARHPADKQMKNATGPEASLLLHRYEHVRIFHRVHRDKKRRKKKGDILILDAEISARGIIARNM